MRNKKISQHLKDNKKGKTNVKDRLNTMAKSTYTKHGTTQETRYNMKFTAGKIIGLQNIIPAFQDQSELVFFTDNNMVAEMQEVNIEVLRRCINEDRNALKKLW